MSESRTLTQLQVGDPVRVIGRWFAGDYARFTGRTGVVTRVCEPPFSRWCYVRLDPRPRERVVKERFFEMKDLGPTERPEG